MPVCRLIEINKFGSKFALLWFFLSNSHNLVSSLCPVSLLAVFTDFFSYSAALSGFSRNFWRQRSRWSTRLSGMLSLSFCGSVIGRHKLSETRQPGRWTDHLKIVDQGRAAGLIVKLFPMELTFKPTESWAVRQQNFCKRAAWPAGFHCPLCRKGVWADVMLMQSCKLIGWADKLSVSIDTLGLWWRRFVIWQGPPGKPGPPGSPGPPGDRVSPQAQGCQDLRHFKAHRYRLCVCFVSMCYVDSCVVCVLSGFHREARRGGTSGPSRHVCKWLFTGADTRNAPALLPHNIYRHL